MSKITPESLDRLYFYVRYKLINPDHHKMMDYENRRKPVEWDVEDGANEKYATPQRVIEGRRIEVRLHLTPDEVEITEDGKDFQYCPDDVLDRCLESLQREGYDLIKL